MDSTRSVIVYPDADAVAEATGARLLLVASDAVAMRGVAHIVLTGGTVGIELLRRAARSPLAQLVDWTSVHVWWGDERFVAAGDQDRNELQAQRALLTLLPLPEDNIHRMGARGDFATADDAANAYDAEIARWHDPAWDVALFGMGPDGHVASLFPGVSFVPSSREHSATVEPRAVAVLDSPKPPAERVTMTVSTIRRARQVWIVATGAEKAPAVSNALGAHSVLPAAAIGGMERTLWLIDTAASTGA